MGSVGIAALAVAGVTLLALAMLYGHSALMRYFARRTALEVAPGIPSRRGMALLKSRVLDGSQAAVMLTLKGGAYLYARETLGETKLGAIAFVNSVPWDSISSMEWDNGKPFGKGSPD